MKKLSLPESIELGTSLHALHTELALHTDYYPTIDSAGVYIDECFLADAVHEVSLNNKLYNTFLWANDVVRAPEPVSAAVPQSPLVLAALGGATIVDLAPYSSAAIENRACFQAELRFARSLRHHDLSTPEDPKELEMLISHEPAAILFDVAGEPFAYRKASGEDTALAWREASLATEAGTYTIPQSMIFELQYEDGTDPCDNHLGEGLISLAHAQPPQDAHLLRFSTTLVPREVARMAHRHAIANVPSYPTDTTRKLRDNLHDALSLNPERLEKRVLKLLASDKVHDV
ncbi:MAG TPA: hypothetical protein VJP80_06915 [Candidatus Saccharimonadales bacterium]|nr:hypothetical protein [Candidatus Saccharimonadales bacterium]